MFDAMCALCSANARFVLRHDRQGQFRLASMQGTVGVQLYRDHGIAPEDPDSLIVMDGGLVLRDSDAVLAIYAACSWPWRTASMLRIVPRRLRDPLYRFGARNRYRIFGRRDTCWILSEEDRGRVL